MCTTYTLIPREQKTLIQSAGHIFTREPQFKRPYHNKCNCWFVQCIRIETQMISNRDDIVLSSDCRFELSLNPYKLHSFEMAHSMQHPFNLAATMAFRALQRTFEFIANIIGLIIHIAKADSDHKITYTISHRTQIKWLHKACCGTSE